MEPAVPFVGLTGGMGAGKSTALAALERLGAAVLSTDAVVHELYQEAQLREAVVARWGPAMAPAGVVDRSAVAERAFARAEDRAWLEGLLWPLVGARVAAWLAQVRAGAPTGHRGRGRPWWRFRCCSRRASRRCMTPRSRSSPMSRCGASGPRQRGHALADERAARQLSQEEKAQRATFVVRNDGSEEDLERGLSAVLEKLG